MAAGDPTRPGAPAALSTSSSSSSASFAGMVAVNGGKYFRDVDHFGKGSFGMVYEAVPVASRPATLPVVNGSRRVCLKLVDLPPTGLSREHTEEIRIWSSLDHENVAPLRDWFVDTVVTRGVPKQRLGLVTDLFEHGSLRAVLERDARERETAAREGRPPRLFLTPRRVRLIAQGVLAGLDFLHTRSPSVVHRDLKSENVCLGVVVGVDGVESADGHPSRVFASEDSLEVRLIDFGLSEERFETLMSSGSLSHGTLAYMGPQHASRSGYSGTADDCWAAGLVLAECLLGSTIEVLFPSILGVNVRDTMEVLRRKLPSGQMEVVEAVVRRCEDTDAVVGRVVRGLLKEKEAERWSSGKALGELEIEDSGMGRLLREEVVKVERRLVGGLKEEMMRTVQVMVEALQHRLEEAERRALAAEAKADKAMERAEEADERARAAEERAEAAQLEAEEAKEEAESLKRRIEELDASSGIELASMFAVHPETLTLAGVPTASPTATTPTRVAVPPPAFAPSSAPSSTRPGTTSGSLARRPALPTKQAFRYVIERSGCVRGLTLTQVRPSECLLRAEAHGSHWCSLLTGV